MTSSTPLLPETELTSDDRLQILTNGDEIRFQSMDQVIEWCTGELSWRQFFQVLLISFGWFFDGQQACISDFSDAEPAWHCTNGVANSTCSSSSNICDLSDESWAWDGPVYQSVLSEWNLECESSFILGLPTSCFYLGCLIGGFAFATLADTSLGRKNLLILSGLIMSLAAFATALSPNVWVYSGLRLVSGFGRAAIGTCALVLSTEMVGKKSRGFTGMMGLFIGTLGLLSLPAIAYPLRNASWRYLYVSTSVPAIFYCVLVYFLVDESPKWLFMQGRDDEAMAIIRRVAPRTKYSQLQSYLSSLPGRKQETTRPDLYTSMNNLLQRRWALARVLKVMVAGFGIGMMYYGMLLGVGDLGFDIYLSVTFSALLIIPSYFASYLLIKWWSRKSTLLAFSVLSGGLSIMCATFVGRGSSDLVGIGMELASFFCTCVAYNVLLIFTTELFPTSVRNSATSMMRQAITLGVLFDPTLISFGRETTYLPYLVFGVAIICCGSLAIFLPETRGVSLCDTMEEQEQRDCTTEES